MEPLPGPEPRHLGARRGRPERGVLQVKNRLEKGCRAAAALHNETGEEESGLSSLPVFAEKYLITDSLLIFDSVKIYPHGGADTFSGEGGIFIVEVSFVFD